MLAENATGFIVAVPVTVTRPDPAADPPAWTACAACAPAG